jgi:threonylcarbamoyladenosine tRNA methylthiotransferase MtaB
MGFGHLHIFPFSPRAGTKAAALADQVSQAVKRDRTLAAHQLGRKLKAETLHRYLGRDFPVLFEDLATSAHACGGDRCWSGYAPNYLRVLVPGGDAQSLENEIKQVRITRVADDGDSLKALLVDG